MTYISELPKDECLRRLHAQPKQVFWRRQAEGTISAKVRGDRFRLFAWGSVMVRNPFAPFFYGRLEETDGGTRIRGRFRMHTLVQAFVFAWFGGLIAAVLLMLFLPSSAWGSGQQPSLLALFGPAFIGLVGLGLVRFCRWLGRGQTESLKNFLIRELKAHPADEAASHGRDH
ncbi:MAG TPA: hypothetical protein VN673_11240 [Clostridia bacterium]|nr:hypothetical protein [Clostridia bacterium]